MAKNQKKIGEKWGMVGDHVGHCIQCPAHISKYGKCGYAKGEIAIKSRKKSEKNGEKIGDGW